MDIIASGYCADCEASVAIEFDDDNGEPHCISCGSFEVTEVMTDEEDYFDDDFEQTETDLINTELDSDAIMGDDED